MDHLSLDYEMAFGPILINFLMEYRKTLYEVSMKSLYTQQLKLDQIMDP